MGVERIGIVIEGMEVNHAHIRVYPFPKADDGFVNGIASGPKADVAELQKIADQIKSNT